MPSSHAIEPAAVETVADYPARPAATDRLVFRVALGLFASSVVFSLAGAALLTYAPHLAAPALAWISGNLGVGLEALIKAPTWVNMGLLPVLTLSLYFTELGARADASPRMDPRPRRTATSLWLPGQGSSTAPAADALRSGVCTTTP